MEQAISTASKSNLSHAVQDVVQYGMRRSAARQAVHVLNYLVDHPHGAEVAAVRSFDIMANEDKNKPSQEILEILVTHGWDINTQGADQTDWPLLWSVVEYPDLVRWCLDHGARVDISESPPRVYSSGSTESHVDVSRPTILGMAATSGSVETFELLRAKGAPLDPRTLHSAVERATAWAPKEGSEPSSFYTERMDMVRHLVDVVKLDVNAIQHGRPGSCSTPLCIVAGWGGRFVHQTVRELADFLLDRGADPHLDCVNWSSAIACAQIRGNRAFLQAVEDGQVEKPIEK